MAKDAGEVTISTDVLRDVIATAVAEAVKAVAPQNSAADLAAVVAKATAEAARALAPEQYRSVRGEEKSVFNPQGERDHPRPDVEGDIYWAGAQLRREQLTWEEIDLINRLQPGEFWFSGNDEGRLLLRIMNLEPAGSNKRRLNIILPGLSDPNTRSNYPSMKRILQDILSVPA
jgi:hypothetical protein